MCLSIEPAKWILGIVHLRRLLGQEQRIEGVEHHRQLVGARHGAAGNNGAGMRTVRNAAGVKRKRRFFHATAAAELAAIAELGAQAHGELRAAIDGSHELLRELPRRFFARISVFRGGFTLEASEDVCEA